MKLDEIKEKLNVSEKAINDNLHFNSLRIVLSDEFYKPETNNKVDYRERSINRCIEANVPFSSESNTIINFAKRFLQVINPKTNNFMESKSAGGNSEGMSILFTDPETKDEMTLFLTNEAFHFKPNENIHKI